MLSIIQAEADARETLRLAKVAEEELIMSSLTVIRVAQKAVHANAEQFPVTGMFASCARITGMQKLHGYTNQQTQHPPRQTKRTSGQTTIHESIDKQAGDPDRQAMTSFTLVWLKKGRYR